jgi:hypothetical protein
MLFDIDVIYCTPLHKRFRYPLILVSGAGASLAIFYLQREVIIFVCYMYRYRAAAPKS